MDVQPPPLNFPPTFCCNCGDINCEPELQETRVTRRFGLGRTDTQFQLPVPVCAACRRSTRRRPHGLLLRLLVWIVTTGVVFGALLWLRTRVTLPLWMNDHLFMVGVLLGFLLVVGFYRLRRPRPPQTSFYQPVRITDVRMRFADGHGQVSFMKLAFTSTDYLHVFSTANQDAIQARRLAAVQA